MVRFSQHAVPSPTRQSCFSFFPWLTAVLSTPGSREKKKGQDPPLDRMIPVPTKVGSGRREYTVQRAAIAAAYIQYALRSVVKSVLRTSMV